MEEDDEASIPTPQLTAPVAQSSNRLLILECPFVAKPDIGAILSYIRSEEQSLEMEAKKPDIWLNGKNLTKTATKNKAAMRYD